jgi:hypothetical protein
MRDWRSAVVANHIAVGEFDRALARLVVYALNRLVSSSLLIRRAPSPATAWARAGQYLRKKGHELAGSQSPQLMRLAGIACFRRAAEHLDW